MKAKLGGQEFKKITRVILDVNLKFESDRRKGCSANELIKKVCSVCGGRFRLKKAEK